MGFVVAFSKIKQVLKELAKNVPSEVCLIHVVNFAAERTLKKTCALEGIL